MTGDTIIALSTPPGVGALAVLRLSGPESAAIVGGLIEGKIAWQPGRAVYRRLVAGEKILDDVVLTFWRAPRSFTGEDTVEISCHGNPRVVEAILRAVLARGARAARPGEFTQRAYLNERLTLTQAEGLLDLLYAPTERALAGARAMHEGRLGRALEAVRAAVVDLLSHLEAALDFAEEGIDPRTGPELAGRLASMRGDIDRLLRTAPLGRLLRHGAATALIGAPNVGKSSLMNALLREDRAIVAPTPGTTRDLIEAACSVRGLPLRLIDTAGQRDSTDPVEQEGARRARALWPQAQLLLHIVAAPEPMPAPLDLPTGVPCLLVANKKDLGRHASVPDRALPVCALTGDGIDELERAIEQTLLGRIDDEASSDLIVNARQDAALQRAAAAFAQAQKNLATEAGLELVSIDLRDGLAELADVIGETTNEDILTRLFQNFCIGK